MNELSSWDCKIANNTDDSNWLNDGPNNLLYLILLCIKDNLEFEKDERYKFPYNHIELYIATLDTLLGLKLDSLRRAAENGYELLSTPRPQDVLDLREILKVFEIKTIEDFLKQYPG